MEFDLASIITCLVSALSGGGVGWLINAKENKRKAQLDNDHSAAEAWKELYERADKESEDTKKEVDALREENSKLHDKINDLTAKYAAANCQKCTVFGCKNRQPPRDW